MQRRSFVLSLVALPIASSEVLQFPSLKKRILTKARQLITNKQNWKTGKHFHVPYTPIPVEDVKIFSAYGALWQAGYLLLRDDPNVETIGYKRLHSPKLFVSEVHELLFTQRQLDEITHINDIYGHQAVLAHLDKLIQEA
jgi:hypothetical protein